MGKHYISRYAVCPCYRSEDRQVIRCGTEQTTIHRVFCNAINAKEYKNKYCRHSFMQCPIYINIAIYEKLSDENKKKVLEILRKMDGENCDN